MQYICLRLFVFNVINKTPVRNTAVSTARTLAATNPHLAPQPASPSPSVFLCVAVSPAFCHPRHQPTLSRPPTTGAPNGNERGGLR